MIAGKRWLGIVRSMCEALRAKTCQSIYGRLAGYKDVNDAERLRLDPAMRQVVGGRATKRLAASSSEMRP
ncbi:MAG TPA: hypothetical protein VM492_08890, partial [Sumerlaeia bacterium]|nr:hypothetical protein [Sumerlaeia bacterium]